MEQPAVKLNEKNSPAGIAPRHRILIALLCRGIPAGGPDMVEHPIPHHEHSRDHDIGEQPGAQEHAGEDEFILHDTPQARAATVSAQVSTFVRIASSSYELTVTTSREKITL